MDIVHVVTQIQTQKMGANPRPQNNTKKKKSILCVCDFVTINIILKFNENVDVNGKLNVKCEQAFTQRLPSYSVNMFMYSHLQR